jgi:hypothetical protein
VGGRGFFKPESEICAVTYHGLVNAVDIAKDTGFKGRFVLLSGMGSELPSFTGRLLNTIRGKPSVQPARPERLPAEQWSRLVRRKECRAEDGPGGEAVIRITPPANRLSIRCQRPGGFRQGTDRRGGCAGCVQAHVRRLQRSRPAAG